MLKQTLIALATAILGLFTPMTALAAPANVLGISLERTSDGVEASWDVVQGATSYKVFWSRESILGNDAIYDDMVETEDDATSIVLTDLPDLDVVFVTVLAVDANGDESPLFEEEASLILRSQSSSAARSSMPTAVITSSVASTGTVPTLPFHAVRAEAISATGVLVTFTMPPRLDAQTARSGFAITDGQGQALAVYRVKTQGTAVELHTLTQVKDLPYRLHVDDIVRGQNGDTIVTLDGGQTDLLFLGHASGSVLSTQPPAGSSTVGNIRDIRVQTAVDGVNSYTVTLSWQPPAGTQVLGYRVSQTRDGGKTYGAPQTVAANVQAVKLQKTPAGDLGLLIQVVDSSQLVSSGVLQRIILPATTGRPVTGTVGSEPGKNGSLPQTGAGTATLLAIAGAYAGVRVQRRRAERA